jgi:hypothetical protein
MLFVPQKTFGENPYRNMYRMQITKGVWGIRSEVAERFGELNFAGLLSHSFTETQSRLLEEGIYGNERD